MNRAIFHIILTVGIILCASGLFAQQNDDGLSDKTKDCILQFTFGYMIGNVTTSCQIRAQEIHIHSCRDTDNDVGRLDG